MPFDTRLGPLDSVKGTWACFCTVEGMERAGNGLVNLEGLEVLARPCVQLRTGDSRPVRAVRRCTRRVGVIIAWSQEPWRGGRHNILGRCLSRRRGGRNHEVGGLRNGTRGGLVGALWRARAPGDRDAMQRSHSALSVAIASLSLGRLSAVHARCSLVSECRRRDSNCSATILFPPPCFVPPSVVSALRDLLSRCRSKWVQVPLCTGC